MIDIQTETVLSLADAARKLPTRRAGKKVHTSCIYRWTVVPGCNGVVLESIQVGGTRCTSIEALQRFCDALTAKAQGQAPAPPPANREREGAIAAARRRLQKAGC